MSSDSITYSFCTQSIRYAYQIIGYDALLKEINFIHHLHTSQTALPSEPTAPSQSTSPILIQNDPVPLPSKNVIIQPDTRKTYTRSTLPNELRCTATIRGGVQCTFQRDTSQNEQNKTCSRHTP